MRAITDAFIALALAVGAFYAGRYLGLRVPTAGVASLVAGVGLYVLLWLRDREA
jgi:hypothetical protein